jgi:hypothetical protein
VEKYLAIITKTARPGGVRCAWPHCIGGTDNGHAVCHGLALANPCRRVRTRAVRFLIDKTNRKHGDLEVLGVSVVRLTTHLEQQPVLLLAIVVPVHLILHLSDP